MVPKQLKSICKKKKSRQTLYLSQINSKLIIDQSVKHKTTKILDNAGKNLDNLEHGDDFLVTTPKPQSMNETIGKLYFIKIKNSAEEDIVKSIRTRPIC